MTDDEKRPYELPTPDLGVFGDDEGTSGEETKTTSDAPQADADEPASGRMRFQDESTRPRPPTLAEQRARQQAAETAREEAIEEQEESERRAHRKRVMIGAGVTVGIVALIGGWYLLSRPDDVTARCTAANGSSSGTVVQDQYCDQDYITAQHGYVSNGIIFLPIPGGGYNQYHYYYGGSGSIGQRVSGGSYTPPANANISTGTGKTVTRGGLGVSGSSGGSGGSGGEEGGSHSGGSHSGGS